MGFNYCYNRILKKRTTCRRQWVGVLHLKPQLYGNSWPKLQEPLANNCDHTAKEIFLFKSPINNQKDWGNERGKIRNESVCLPEVWYPWTLGHNFVLLWHWLLPLPSRKHLTVVLELLSVSWCVWKVYIHRYTVPGKAVPPDKGCHWNTGQVAGTKTSEYFISSLHTPTHGKEGNLEVPFPQTNLQT